MENQFADMFLLSSTFSIVYFGIYIFMVVCLWKIFEKAGQPGWSAIIPIYNMYIFLQIAGKPGWWIILMFVPVINIVFMIMAYISFAQRFGLGIGFTIGMILLPFIFFPILAFGSHEAV